MTDTERIDTGSRRGVLRALALAATGVGAGSGLATADRGDSETGDTVASAGGAVAPSGGAPMLRYDSANTGRVASGAVPTDGVTTRWTFDTGASLTSQPVVVDGTVFVGNADGTLYALDAGTGTEQWSRTHDESLSAGPVVAGGLVYVPAGGRLLAYAAATGDGQFSVDVGGAVGTPTVADGTLYTRASGQLHAVDATGGEVAWSVGDFAPELSASRAKELAVTVADGSVYVLYPDEGYDANIFLASYPADPGADAPSPEWETEIVGYRQYDVTYDTTVTAANGTLYVGLWSSTDSETPAGVAAVDPEDGTVEWRYASAGDVKTYPTVTDDTVYAAAESELVGIDPALGTAKWSVSLSGEPTSPILVGDTLVFGSSDDSVYAYGTDGEQRWSFATGNNVAAPPVAVDGTVYAASTDGVVYALGGADTGPTAPDVTGDGNPATDPDGDGVFEDVNGDGEFSVVDVQALFANLDAAAVQDNPELFDFNGDGQVDVTDVQALFAKLQEEG